MTVRTVLEHSATFPDIPHVLDGWVSVSGRDSIYFPGDRLPLVQPHVRLRAIWLDAEVYPADGAVYSSSITWPERLQWASGVVKHGFELRSAGDPDALEEAIPEFLPYVPQLMQSNIVYPLIIGASHTLYWQFRPVYRPEVYGRWSPVFRVDMNTDGPPNPDIDPDPDRDGGTEPDHDPVWVSHPAGYQCQEPLYRSCADAAADLEVNGILVYECATTYVAVITVCGAPTSTHFNCLIDADDVAAALSLWWLEAP
jgi:hypothetical protein